jgi:hypothetical protein
MTLRVQFLFPKQWIAERTSWYYSTILKDERGQALASVNLTSLTLTLYDLSGGALAIVNSVDHVNILNTGRGLVDAVGKLDLTLVPADTQILDSTRSYEKRRALLEWTYASGAKIQRLEVDFIIANVAKVT